ncbi:hypothetical protein [Actinokineospora sp. NBRC 105648]|uniref:hypothetical protein n=1 Tax=Actinokineospora sp. NBRC 105648 TaxID=3032206 RepID=UPI0025577A48|nr:hypothetical protein [Actinokineospora sp. NBRC 105648]
MTAALGRETPVVVRAVDELWLVARPTALCCARLFAASVSQRWDLVPGVASVVDAALVELTAHSIATTSGAVSDELVLRLSLYSEAVGVEVWDTGSVDPDPRLAGARVLAAVEGWGSTVHGHRGRVVWCLVATAPAGSGLGEGLC